MSDEITVPLQLLQRYLTFHGWKRQDRAVETGSVLDSHSIAGNSFAATFFRQRSIGQRNIDLYVLSEASPENVELIVPQTMESRDSTRRLRGVIETLSQVEGRAPTQVVADIRSIGFDLVKSRIPDELVSDDTIQLEQAVNYTTGVKKLLAAAATTELRPGPYFWRVKKEGAAYAERCRFGHTFRGSFGFTIESPVSQNVETPLPGMEQNLVLPFERRIIQRLAQGINVIQEAVLMEDPAVVVNGFRSGFSANMCEEFASLIEQTAPAGMTFGFVFSPEWPAVGVDDVQVGPLHVEVSRIAAKTMREQSTPESVEVSGRITRLQNEADPTDLLDQTHEGEIIVYWKSDEFGSLNVRTHLTPNDYLTAVAAHMRGRPVRVKGRLERQGRRWVLMEPTEFSA